MGYLVKFFFIAIYRDFCLLGRKETGADLNKQMYLTCALNHFRKIKIKRTKMFAMLVMLILLNLKVINIFGSKILFIYYTIFYLKFKKVMFLTIIHYKLNTVTCITRNTPIFCILIC